MAFGQASGPPAQQRQLQQISDLLSQQGFDSLREARHPLGLSQRQAGGKFSVDEADELIERLEAARDVADPASPGTESSNATTGFEVPSTGAAKQRAAKRQLERDGEALAVMDSALMADELTRRGWCCIPPE